MSKYVWNSVYPLRPAEGSPGNRVTQDYFGLYKEKDSNSKLTQMAFGESARVLANKTAREALNFGKYFSGFLAGTQVGPVNLIVGMHSELGLCAFIDQPTSLAPSLIEIFVGSNAERRTVTRHYFFDGLFEEPLKNLDVQTMCDHYLNAHIKMKHK